MDSQKKFVLNDLIIKPNFENKGWSRCVKDDFPIYIDRRDDDYEYLGISLEEAEFIITSLNEIIEHYKNMPEFKKGVIFMLNKILTDLLEDILNAIEQRIDNLNNYNINQHEKDILYKELHKLMDDLERFIVRNINTNYLN